MTTGALSNGGGARQLQRTVKAFTTVEKIRFPLVSRQQKGRRACCAPSGQNTPPSITVHVPVNRSTPNARFLVDLRVHTCRTKRFFRAGGGRSRRAIVPPETRTVTWNPTCGAKARGPLSPGPRMASFIQGNPGVMATPSRNADAPLSCATCQL